MYVVEDRINRPQYNLALEEHLCNMAAAEGSSFFMLWQNEPSIIVGRFQNTLEEINTAFVERNGIHVVRRNSGGGAVYHDLGNINYSFVMPDSVGDFDFALFTKPIVAALADLGVHTEHSGRNDLAIDGKKFSGGAQFRRRGIVLHHGTLLYDSDLDVLSQALKVSEDKFQSKAVKSVRSRVTNIAPYLSSPLEVADFIDALQKRIEHLKPRTLERADFDEVERLAAEKYSSWEWNYGSSPRFTERKKKRFAWGGVEAFIDVADGILKDCSFRGDFFGNGDYAPLLARIAGVPYTKEELNRSLEGFETKGIFAGSQTEDLIALLSPEI